MKNWKVFLVAVFAAFGIFVASSLAESNNSHENTALESSASSARELYVRNCARCHGNDGKSQTEAGLRLDAPDLTELKPSKAKIVRVITNGADGMPAFGSKLKKNEINLLANYVRSL